MQPQSTIPILERVLIYALSDPRDPHDIRYVGQTSRDLRTRLVQHVAAATRATERSTACAQWIYGLACAGFPPHITLLEVVHRDNADDAERQHIGIYASSGRLLNSVYNPAAPSMDSAGHVMPEPDSVPPDLTIADCAVLLGETRYGAARRRVERAIADGQLAFHWGIRGGRRLKLVDRRDFALWRAQTTDPMGPLVAEAAFEWQGQLPGNSMPAFGDDSTTTTGRDDRDDTGEGEDHDDAPRDDRGQGTPPAERAGAEEAQERVSAMLRDVQSGAITEAVRQVLPLVQEIKDAYERIGRSDAEGAMWRERAERAERALAEQEAARRQHDDDDDAGDEETEGEQRRRWWRFWARGEGKRIGQRCDISP